MIKKFDISKGSIKYSCVNCDATKTENIVFEDGQIILADGDTDAKIINSTGEALVWMSGSDSVTVKLYDGEYTLHEEAAPSGYLVATDIKFTIENGVLKDMEKVDMTDDKIVVTIDKKVMSGDTATNPETDAVFKLTVINDTPSEDGEEVTPSALVGALNVFADKIINSFNRLS